MWILIAALTFLRLLMWKIWPWVGISHYSDIVFGVCCLTTLVVYGLFKADRGFSPPLILLVMSAAGTTIIHRFTDLDVKFLLSLDTSLLVVLAILSIDQIRKIKWLLGCLISYAVLSSLVGIWQIAWLGDHRASGLQGWPLSLAGQLLLFMPWVMTSRSFTLPVILCLGFISPLSLMPTFSLAVAYSRWRGWLLAIPLLIPAFFSKNLAQAFATRWEYLQNGFHYLYQSPIFGAGVGRYIYSEASPSAFVHNSYLQIWIEHGILGFIAISWFAIIIFDNPLVSKAKWVWIGLCAFLLDNFFSYTLLKPNTSFLFWVMFGVYANLQTKENPSP